jgi:hypothetical protein
VGYKYRSFFFPITLACLRPTEHGRRRTRRREHDQTRNHSQTDKRYVDETERIQSQQTLKLKTHQDGKKTWRIKPPRDPLGAARQQKPQDRQPQAARGDALRPGQTNTILTRTRVEHWRTNRIRHENNRRLMGPHLRHGQPNPIPIALHYTVPCIPLV